MTTTGAKLIQIIYIPFMDLTIGDNISGIVTGIFVTAIFIILNIQNMNRSFSLITTITEKTGKFFGGGEESLGDGSGLKDSQGSFVAVSSKTEKGLGHGAGSLVETANYAGAKSAEKKLNNATS
ncbi:MAG: hypothetical protein GY928_05205 [Colwellia sp.]|nr:hypothetical protein [Colwellia sp.]